MYSAEDVRPLPGFSGLGEPVSLNDLARSVGKLDVDSTAVAEYLRSGNIVFAIMEQTFDRLGQKFTVAGGSAVMTDGVYYWRRDTAEYVEHYKIGLPVDFLHHGIARSWTAVELNPFRLTEIDRFLLNQMRDGGVRPDA